MRDRLSARFREERICTAATLKEVAVSLSTALSVIGNETAAANEQNISATIFMTRTNGSLDCGFRRAWHHRNSRRVEHGATGRTWRVYLEVLEVPHPSSKLACGTASLPVYAA